MLLLQISKSSLLNSTAVMQVFDFNRFHKHNIIGELRLQLCNVDWNHVIEEWQDLAEPAKFEVFTHTHTQTNYFSKTCPKSPLGCHARWQLRLWSLWGAEPVNHDTMKGVTLEENVWAEIWIRPWTLWWMVDQMSCGFARVIPLFLGFGMFL